MQDSTPPTPDPTAGHPAVQVAAADLPGPGRLLTFVMAAAAGLAAANIYYNQPMLGLIEASFSTSPLTHLVPTATQAGYALGLLFLVPLGDLLERRRLIVLQFLTLAVALAGAALAPTALALILASLLVGAGATAAQQIVPFAAALARPAERGRVIGLVMAGLFCGILGSRTLAGFVAGLAGWRAMFWLGIPLALGSALLLRLTLPLARPLRPVRYGAAMASLAGFWRSEPELRVATLAQAGLFASFSTFWTVLALHLQEPAFRLGAQAAGLFGLIGIAGILAAPLAGRLSDRKGAAPVILAGAAVAFAAWGILGFWNSVAGLAIGVVILDFGIQTALISHQHVIFALQPEARNRLNTVFMTGMFVGGALGSASSTFAWAAGGWPAVSLLGALFALAGLMLRLVRSNRPVAAGA